MFHVYKTVSGENLFAFIAIGVVIWVILCSEEGEGRVCSASRSQLLE